jgi:hypothetical protein
MAVLPARARPERRRLAHSNGTLSMSSRINQRPRRAARVHLALAVGVVERRGGRACGPAGCGGCTLKCAAAKVHCEAGGAARERESSPCGAGQHVPGCRTSSREMSAPAQTHRTPVYVPGTLRRAPGGGMSGRRTGSGCWCLCGVGCCLSPGEGAWRPVRSCQARCGGGRRRWQGGGWGGRADHGAGRG